MIANFLKNITKLGEAILLLRLGLKALAANVNTFFVAQFYSLTNWLIWPFRGIFPDVKLPNGGVIDLTTVAAMVIYVFIVYLLLRLIKIFRS